MLKKCFKSVLFWLIFFPLLYTLSGFIVLPWWVRVQLPELVHEKFGLSISMENVLFNPFTFELHVNHFVLHDTNGSTAASLEHVYVNYEPTALFKKEFFVKSLLLDQPFVDLKVDKTGTLTLLNLFPKTDTNESNSSQESTLAMPFSIEHVDITNAKALFSDERPSEPFKLEIGPINYAINNLSFYKDDLSIHALKAMVQNEEKITLASSVSFEPLKFYGELNIVSLPLSNFWKYAFPNIPATLTQGELTLRVPFLIDLSKEKPLVSLEKASALLNSVHFVDAHAKTILDIPALSLEAIDFDWQSTTFAIEKATITKAFVDVQLEKEYMPNLVRLFTPPNTTATPQPKVTALEKPSTWKFALKSFELNDATIDLLNQNVKKSAPIHFAPLTLSAHNITQDMHNPITYTFQTAIDTNASLGLKGSFVPATTALEMNVKASKLSLETAQPYISLFTTTLIQDGAVSLDANLKASFAQKPTFSIDANATVSKFSLADHLVKPLVAWETLSLSNASYTLRPETLNIQTIVLDKPYINLDIKKDGSTNFSNLLVPTSSKQPPKKQKVTTNAQESMAIYIGNIVLKRGTTHFQDASLLLPFATFADRLNGSMSTLDTKNTKPSVLKLEGKVDKHGYAKIDGSILPFDFKDRANLKVLFKNIDMPSLTPYSGKFIGYAIKEGKLSMDLNYKIKKGLMEGANKINLDALTLGEKIESEDATNLPLSLAIAILKDSKGQIDIDLPVSGNLNDPEFRYGSIVWKAIGNLIASVATSPFKLLGAMLGIEAENLKSIDFAAGEFALIDSEEEKMEQYRQILDKKTELKLLITPSFNEALDTKALQEQNIMAQLDIMTAKKGREDDSYGKAIKKLFVQKYSEEEYTKLMKSAKEENLDVGAIHDRLIAQIAQNITIAPEALQALAHQRADAIIRTLTEKYKIAPSRLIKQAFQNSDAIRDEWVGCAISVSN